MKKLLVWVALGGAVGAMARHGVDLVAGGDFPWHTLLINVLGSGLLAALPLSARVRSSHALSAFWGAGVLGGFTTMSAFSEQTRVLVATGRPVTAAVYVLLSVLGALIAVHAVRLIPPRGEPR